jgi:F-type H+-transporting ATPase subunit epsilon
MPNTFHLVVASVGKTLFDGAALSAMVPGEAGDMTILPNHEPIVTTLRAGSVVIQTAQGTETVPVESGVLECSGSRVVILL